MSALAAACLLVESAIAEPPKSLVPPKGETVPVPRGQSEADKRQKELASAAETGDKLSAIILLLQDRIEKQRKLGKMPGSTSQADELEAIVLQLADQMRELRARLDKLEKGIRP